MHKPVTINVFNTQQIHCKNERYAVCDAKGYVVIDICNLLGVVIDSWAGIAQLV